MNENQTAVPKKSFFQKYIFNVNKKLLGSALTMLLGFGLWGSAVEGSNPPAMKDVGLGILLGGWVCYSAKKTKLGLAKPSVLRQLLEILGLILALLLSHAISGDGLSIIAALWILTAYLVIKFKKKNKPLSN